MAINKNLTLNFEAVNDYPPIRFEIRFELKFPIRRYLLLYCTESNASLQAHWSVAVYYASIHLLIRTRQQ